MVHARRETGDGLSVRFSSSKGRVAKFSWGTYHIEGFNDSRWSENMVINIGSDLETALIESARRQGVEPEVLAQDALRERFLAGPSTIQPRSEWERLLLSTGSDCAVSLSDSALSSDGLYEW